MKILAIILIVLLVCVAWFVYKPGWEYLPSIATQDGLDNLPTLSDDPNAAHTMPEPGKRQRTINPYPDQLAWIMGTILDPPLTSDIPAPSDKLDRIAMAALADYKANIISESTMQMIYNVCAQLKKVHADRAQYKLSYNNLSAGVYSGLKGGISADDVKNKQKNEALIKWKQHTDKIRAGITANIKQLRADLR